MAISLQYIVRGMFIFITTMISAIKIKIFS